MSSFILSLRWSCLLMWFNFNKTYFFILIFYFEIRKIAVNSPPSWIIIRDGKLFRRPLNDFGIVIKLHHQMQFPLRTINDVTWITLVFFRILTLKKTFIRHPIFI